MKIKSITINDHSINYYYVRQTDKWIIEIYNNNIDELKISFWYGEDEPTLEELEYFIKL